MSTSSIKQECNEPDTKKRRMNDTCTVRAWSELLSRLCSTNPDAILACNESVLHIDNLQTELWVLDNEESNEYNSKKKETVDNDKYFNVARIKPEGTYSGYKLISDVLEVQDTELDRNRFEKFKELVNSVKNLPSVEQIKKISKNTRFRNKVYFFPDEKIWYTPNDIRELCGGKICHNFDELFCKIVCRFRFGLQKLPYKIIS